MKKQYGSLFLAISLLSVGAGVLTAPIAFASAPLPMLVAPEAQNAMSDSLAPMLKKVMPAVVNIVAQGDIKDSKNPFREDRRPLNEKRPNAEEPESNPEQKFESIGSGVIVNAEKGYIVTNNHVIADAKTITVNLSDGRDYTAKVIGTDKSADLAVLQIRAKNLEALSFGDSAKLQVGDFVAAIGSPYGLNQTVTSGIVSALHRPTPVIEGYQDFIQTDASINPGNSGGALVNFQGQLVGINTAIITPEDGGNVGIGFAIPSDMVKSLVNQLIEYGSVKRGLLGVLVQNLTPSLADAFGHPGLEGALITRISPDSPAQAMGLQPGDVITAVNNQPVKTSYQVRNIIGLLRVNSPITLQINRDGKPLTVTTQLVDPKKQAAQVKADNPLFYGVTMRQFDQQMPAYGHVRGVQVLNVEPATDASRANLLPGDVIVSANLKPIQTLSMLDEILTKKPEELVLNVLRHGGAFFLVLKQG